jgi:plastocyanin
MNRIRFPLIYVLSLIGIALSASLVVADDRRNDGDRRSDNVAVSFGLWDPNKSDLMGAPLDRILGDPAQGVGVNDILVPNKVTIKEGDSVNFIISGGHVLTIYDDGTKPKDIGGDIEPNCAFPLPTSGITTPCSPVNNAGVPQAGGILSDANGRIYRGAFLNVNPVRRDGVEVVQFTEPGTYLVICSRKNHFIDSATGEFQMFGFVKVEKDRNKR